MARTGTKRAWLAAVLALVYPGLGHVYLREWVRALLWFGLALASAALVTPSSAMSAEFSLDAVLAASRNLPTEAALVVLSVTVISMLDAYWLATRHNRQLETRRGEQCPHCGRELDRDLDFCPWCTEPLGTPADE